ncbi:MAG TPA: TonB-dependent receptor [Saprospiraceae bacterium]|nr:TonB-dependent receptor [Saprospiraceae bacterium]HPI04876.1 TonB-dependent receptor [Saprospiraceae bacterium]
MHYSTLFLLLFCSALQGQNTGALTGSVRDKLTQEALIGATVQVDGLTLGAVTDANGNFKIGNIPPKSYNIVASYLGYTPQTRFNVVVTTGNANQLNFELEPDNKSLGEVVVTENRSVRIASIETPLSIQNLSAEEIKSNPGGNFDISRVVQALPGVSGVAGTGGGFRNDLIIRGGGPSENVFYLDGVEIPVINHFTTQGAAGGPTGLLNVAFIEDATLASSAFNARYDNALSSVLQFRQRDGNPERLQANLRVGASETAITAEGPLGKKNGKTTFLASARRSYLQLLFKAIGLPIRPDYWDFQYKVTHKINAKTTFTALGVGAIDDFYFEAPKESTPENLYILSSVPGVNQWNYTQGFALKRLIDNGFWNLTFSRNMLDNQLDQFTDNADAKQTDEAKRILGIKSQEIENKLRFDINRYAGNWKFSAGAMAQYVKYNNNAYTRLRAAVLDSTGTVVQPALESRFSTAIDFVKFGVFGQVNRTFINDRLGVSAGIRADGNSFTDDGANPLQTLSPRIGLSYAFAPKWKANASIGRYYKMPLYTVLGYRDDSGSLVNQDQPYLRSDHYVAGLEFVPSRILRLTLEGFYKQYADYPVSVFNGVSLANQGGGFGILGNEPVLATGRGEAYGMELFAQQKLNKSLYFTGSFTYFWSKFSNLDGQLSPSAWDNRLLLSLLTGYKLRRNWELGLKYRLQGGVPYTPLDLEASRLNYASIGTGVLDYTKLNALRLGNFSQLDIRIDKKWNFRRATLDVFIDIQNVLSTVNPAPPSYTFQRTADGSAFVTTDNKPLQADGSNAIPFLIENTEGSLLPSVGIVVEF